MSRTRGSSHRFHQDDGEIFGKGGVPIPVATPAAHQGRVPLDRQGNPISPAAATLEAPRKLSGHVVLRGPGAEPVPVPGAVIGYRADRTTFSRNMEAHDLAMLLDLAFRGQGTLGEGFVIELTLEQFSQCAGDLRRHFMAVRQPVAADDE